MVTVFFFFFFFFQAEDGIRDLTVTGVQTCALPICWRGRQLFDFTLRNTGAGNGGARDCHGPRACDSVLLNQALFSGLRQFRKMRPRIGYPLLVHDQRTEIGFGEVAVIVTSFLRSARSNRFARTPPQQRLLPDLPAGIERGTLPFEFGLQRPLNRGERVHVLYLGLGSELRLPGRTHADVRVNTETSLFHTHVADIEILQDLFQCPEVGACSGGSPDVRLAHDLDEWNASPIEVNGGRAGITVVNRFAGVLFHMQASYSDLDVASL